MKIFIFIALCILFVGYPLWYFSGTRYNIVIRPLIEKDKQRAREAIKFIDELCWHKYENYVWHEDKDIVCLGIATNDNGKTGRAYYLCEKGEEAEPDKKVYLLVSSVKSNKRGIERARIEAEHIIEEIHSYYRNGTTFQYVQIIETEMTVEQFLDNKNVPV